jgi:hypothetical protein
MTGTIPPYLTDLDRWILWQNVIRAGKQTKIPISVRGGPAADVTDPRNWGSHAFCAAARVRTQGAWDGEGIVLGDLGTGEALVGLDLDSCLVDGRLAEWARPYLDVLDTYAEVSPSGVGLKLFFRVSQAELPTIRAAFAIPPNMNGRKKTYPNGNGNGTGEAHGPAAEIYLSHRFFTVTGRQWHEAGEHVALIGLDAIRTVAALFGPRETTIAGSDDIGDATAPAPEALRAKLAGALRDRPYLAERWLGIGTGLTDTSRSGFDMSLGSMLKAAGFTYGEMRAAILANPHGAGPEHANDERYFERIWSRSVVPARPQEPEPPPPIDDPNYWLSIKIDAPQIAPPPWPETETWTPTTRVFDPWNTMRPVRFDLAMLPDHLAQFVQSRANTIGADPCALAWATISAASAAVHGEIRLLMKRYDSWTVPAAIWVALVGEPSTKKTPIIDTAWRPHIKIQTVELREYLKQLNVWKRLPKKERDDTPEPTQPRRLVSHDGTIEAMQDIMVRQSRGVGIVRDELAGWIGSMEKYAPGKGGAADRAFWLQSYNGGAHVVDRVARGTLPIENLLATICGGIQPDRLRQFRDLTDDGLWQRFAPIIVAEASIGTDEPTDQTPELYDRLINRLLRDTRTRLVHLSSDAHAIREEVQRRTHAMEQADVLGARFTGFIGKLTGLWGRISLVLHLLGDNAFGDVSGETARMARDLVFQSALPNAARVYAAMGGAGGDIEATRSIAGYILTKRLQRIVMSDLTANVRVCRHKATEDIRKLISPLEAGGWLMPEKEFNPNAWLVNDAVHTFFTERTQREILRRAMVRALITGADFDPDNPDTS